MINDFFNWLLNLIRNFGKPYTPITPTPTPEPAPEPQPESEPDTTPESPFIVNVTYENSDPIPGFEAAVTRLKDVIPTEAEVNVTVRVIRIDGGDGVLAQAAPTHWNPSTGLITDCFIEFDTDDLDSPALYSIGLHELLHGLGIGTHPFWADLIEDGKFVGANAFREWRALSDLAGVPIEGGNVPGTSGAHWAEQALFDELMTGYLSGDHQPLSRITIAALEDIGWDVNYDEADEFWLWYGAALLSMHDGQDAWDCGTCGNLELRLGPGSA